jgi:hypothetical protein
MATKARKHKVYVSSYYFTSCTSVSSRPRGKKQLGNIIETIFSHSLLRGVRL